VIEPGPGQRAEHSRRQQVARPVRLFPGSVRLPTGKRSSPGKSAGRRWLATVTGMTPRGCWSASYR